MAPSSNYTLIALLVAFAVVAPSLLHQSAAARDGGAAKAAAAPAPSANGEVVLHPTASYEIPDLPLPRIIPCPPLVSKDSVYPLLQRDATCAAAAATAKGVPDDAGEVASAGARQPHARARPRASVFRRSKPTAIFRHLQ
jgi:hypothetical protein